MHDRPGGPAPAILAPVRQTGDAGRTAAPLAAFLSPGLHAAFDGCLTEALPADLADLLGRLDRAGGAQKPGSPRDRDAAARGPRTPDSFKRS
ncbi:hypothetical protein [Methylobacterium sp. 174MFSha1.1]|uniref:hypothetical protein n=1 Tax=Methylobacterium sp. 174MFSha1.1 TaxID=1502749 RepID=UPI000B81DB0E|nr:hypothetical protein [Methylobacterium sp. 174MFSha1.1]